MSDYSDVFYHSQTYVEVSADTVSTLRAPNPHQFLINLEFSRKLCFLLFGLLPENSTVPVLLRTANTFLPDAHVALDLPHLSCLEKARETIGGMFENWRLSDEQRRKLIGTVLFKVWEGVESMHAGHNVINIRLVVNLVCEDYLDGSEEAIVDRVMRRSMDDDDVVCMVPTDDSAIESLERKKTLPMGLIEGSSCCAICIDEFVKGCEVVSMPCGHDFHGVCIKKWLRTSHYCPVCRFEMPTRDHRFGEIN